MEQVKKKKLKKKERIVNMDSHWFKKLRCYYTDEQNNLKTIPKQLLR